MLSEDINNLWSQLARQYTEHPEGVRLTVTDCHTILSRLWEMYEAALALESKVPPEPVIPTGPNVIEFSKHNQKRRV